MLLCIYKHILLYVCVSLFQGIAWNIELGRSIYEVFRSIRFQIKLNWSMWIEIEDNVESCFLLESGIIVI